MAFPSSPDDGDQYTTENGTVYEYDSGDNKWFIVTGDSVASDLSDHESEDPFDGHGQNVIFKVSDDSGQSLSTGYSSITWNTEDFDYGNNFDLANNKFIVPEDGQYHFSITILFASSSWTAGDIMELQLYDGTNLWKLDRPIAWGSQTEYFPIHGSVTLDLSKDDEIYVRVFNGRGGSTSLHSDSDWCHWEGFKIG